jgi:hypothetical protein
VRVGRAAEAGPEQQQQAKLSLLSALLVYKFLSLGAQQVAPGRQSRDVEGSQTILQRGEDVYY